MSQAALQNGSLNMLDAIKVLKADSLNEAETILERGMDTMKKMQQQSQEQVQQQQVSMQEQAMQQQKMEVERKNAELQNKLDIAKVTADSRVTVAEINQEGKLESEILKEKTLLA